MQGSVALPPLDSVWVSAGLVGAHAWRGSGSRVTGDCWDTSPEKGWASWEEEGCERRVLPQ